MEAIGDITASAEVSRVAVDGVEFDTRIQGGVLVNIISFLRVCFLILNFFPGQSDGIGGFFSALFTVPPLSIFAQVMRFVVFLC